MAQIRRDLSKYTLLDLINLLKLIVSKMTGNVKYTALAPKVVTYKGKVDALEAADLAVQANETEHERLVIVRTNARDAAEAAYATLASATEGESAAAEDLSSGGWPLRGGPPAPVGPLPAPAGLSATTGDHEGTVDLACDGNPKVSIYKWQYAENATGPWTAFLQGTRSSCTVTGLVPGKLYYFRVCASGSAGDSEWSDLCQKRAG